MGNSITRTVLFAASALLSMCAFGAGAARFGTLRNSDWVVTNAWQAVSNRTHDLIVDMSQEASLPPNWLNVSNAAMSAESELSTNVYTKSETDGLISTRVRKSGDMMGPLQVTNGNLTVYSGNLTVYGWLLSRVDSGTAYGANMMPTAFRVWDATGQTEYKHEKIEINRDGNTYSITIPRKSGTFALTNDIPDVGLALAEFSRTGTIYNAHNAEAATYAVSAADAGGSDYLRTGDGMDSLTATDLLIASTNAATWVASAKIATNAMAGQTYDFSRNYDIIRATANLIKLFGGIVTNNPTANGGN